MKIPLNIETQMIVAMVFCTPFISSCVYDDVKRPVLAGAMFSPAGLFSGIKLIPKSDIKVTIVEKDESAIIRLESKRWEITGFGMLDAPSAEVYKITIDGIHGRASKNGSVKQMKINKLPKQRVEVVLD